MNNLQDFRAQEAQCRKRAEIDDTHRDLWLSMAERWSYLAQKEDAPHFKERIHSQGVTGAPHAAG